MVVRLPLDLPIKNASRRRTPWVPLPPGPSSDFFAVEIRHRVLVSPEEGDRERELALVRAQASAVELNTGQLVTREWMGYCIASFVIGLQLRVA